MGSGWNLAEYLAFPDKWLLARLLTSGYTRTCGTHKVEEVSSQSLLIPLPCRIRDKDSYLIQLESRGVVQISVRDRPIVLKPEFSVADAFGRLIIESSDSAEVFGTDAARSSAMWQRQSAMRSHRDEFSSASSGALSQGPPKMSLKGDRVFLAAPGGRASRRLPRWLRLRAHQSES